MHLRSHKAVCCSLAVLTLVSACGGGGGSSVAPPIIQPPPPQPPSMVALDEVKSGKLGGAVLDVFVLARDLTEGLRPGILASIPTGTSSVVCPNGGSVARTVTANRLQLTEQYNNCEVFDLILQAPFIVTGTRSATYSAQAGNNAYSVQVDLENFESIADDGVTENVNGTAIYNAGLKSNDLSQDSFIFDIDAVNSREGRLTLSNVALDVDNTTSFLNDLLGVTSMTGTITHDIQGSVDLSFDDVIGRVILSGTGDAVGAVQARGLERLTISHHDDISSGATAFLKLEPQDLREIEFFNESNSVTPSLRSTFIAELNNAIPLKQDVLRFSLRRNFWDRDGDLLTLEILLTGAEIRNRTGPPEIVDAADPRLSFDMTQDDAGNILFESQTVGTRVIYNYTATPIDSSGSRGQTSIDFNFSVYLDSDLDGSADSFDDDDDNDGVRDSSDQFPLDSTESSDNDADGTGDNADLDDDNDGTPDVSDSYPFDDRCFLDTDGDGIGCILSRISGNSDYLVDQNAIVYVWDYSAFSPDSHLIRRFDTNTGHFIDSFSLDPSLVGLAPEDAPFEMRYVSAHHTIYVIYAGEFTNKLDLSGPNPVESFFKTKEANSTNLFAVSDYTPYAVVGEQELRIVSRFSYDATGTLIDSYTWPDDFGGPPFTLAANANFCDSGVSVDRTDGTFFEYTNAGLYRCDVFGEPLPSPDESLIVLAGLEILDTELATTATITMQGNPDNYFRWSWSNNGIFIPSSAGIEVFDAGGNAITTLSPNDFLPQNYRGLALPAGTNDVIIYEYSSGFRFELYMPPMP